MDRHDAGLPVRETVPVSCCPSPLDVAVDRTPTTDAVRRGAFTALRAGTALTLAELATVTGVDLDQVRGVVAQLVTAGLATIDGDLAGDALVDGAEGMTVRGTPHQLVLDGQLLHTWCAFDTVGIFAALRVDAVARTGCPTCGARLEIVLRGGQPPLSTVAGWWPLASAGPVNESFCPTAQLFCTLAHLRTWQRISAAGPGDALTLTELSARGRSTWSLFINAGDPP